MSVRPCKFLDAKVQNSLRKQIFNGTLTVREQTPKEEELYSKHSVSPITISRAVAILAEKSLTGRIHGSGMFVNSIIPIGRHAPAEGFWRVFPERSA